MGPLQSSVKKKGTLCPDVVNLEQPMSLYKYLSNFLTILYPVFQSLLSLPESIRGEYEHLITAPKLLLEQLLMNMKVSSPILFPVIFVHGQIDDNMLKKRIIEMFVIVVKGFLWGVDLHL